MKIDVEVFVTRSGKKPFSVWWKRLGLQAQSIVSARITRIQTGNFGDCKSLTHAKGLYELRIHYGPGYRVYFGKKNNKVVLLLCGGNKSTQKKDIKKALELWEEYKNE